MEKIIYLSEAYRIFKRKLNVNKKGIKKYKGNAKEICKQIVKDCWNGKYFQTSAGHFSEFYMGDFGWCVDSLVILGYKKEVNKTLSYALSIYSKKGLKTTITPNEKTVDIFAYGPDTLAFLIRSLRVTNAKNLINKYKSFLINEINLLFRKYFNPETGLIYEDKKLSSIKDHSIRKSSTYDNMMVAMLSDELNKLNFYNPFKKYDIKKSIKQNLWNGKFFYDDLNKKQYVTGDSNVFPFWTEVFKDKKMLKSCIESIKKANLDKPFPLKFSDKNYKHKKRFIGIFAKSYQDDSIWTHIGLLYISLIKKIDKKLAKYYINKYTKIIEENKNYLEIFDSKGKPFKTLFYYSDESMLWAANYLTLIQELSK